MDRTRRAARPKAAPARRPPPCICSSRRRETAIVSAAPSLHDACWHPTRAAGLERLRAFLPGAGRDYAARRNFDHGPGNRANVSGLSPWIRRRLITEQEVVAAAHALHGAAADKFIQEVCWRTYWKGWLELRPAVLERFDQERRALRAGLGQDAALAARVEQAQQGNTGIECFDAWAHELVTSGWLHNHARMWFASIWIFTLKLPWQLGADFFYKHLLDADPASNTLSWRWVAGLHTPGKHYLARAANIREYSGGRFDPDGQLAERAMPLTEPQRAPRPAALSAPDAHPGGRSLLLLTDDDLHPESWPSPGDVVALASLRPAAISAAGSPAAQFTAGALRDALQRASAQFGVESGGVLDEEDVLALAAQAGTRTIVTAEAPIGPTAWALARLQVRAAERGLALVRLRRRWDAAAWPKATAGYFRFREQIPALVRQFAQQEGAA